MRIDKQKCIHLVPNILIYLFRGTFHLIIIFLYKVFEVRKRSVYILSDVCLFSTKCRVIKPLHIYISLHLYNWEDRLTDKCVFQLAGDKWKIK